MAARLIQEQATINGYGPRVAEPGLNLIGGYAWSVPYEELRLEPRCPSVLLSLKCQPTTFSE